MGQHVLTGAAAPAQEQLTDEGKQPATRTPLMTRVCFLFFSRVIESPNKDKRILLVADVTNEDVLLHGFVEQMCVISSEILAKEGRYSGSRLQQRLISR